MARSKKRPASRAKKARKTAKRKKPLPRAKSASRKTAKRAAVKKTKPARSRKAMRAKKASPPRKRASAKGGAGPAENSSPVIIVDYTEVTVTEPVLIETELVEEEEGIARIPGTGEE